MRQTEDVYTNDQMALQTAKSDVLDWHVTSRHERRDVPGWYLLGMGMAGGPPLLIVTEVAVVVVCWCPCRPPPGSCDLNRIEETQKFRGKQQRPLCFQFQLWHEAGCTKSRSWLMTQFGGSWHQMRFRRFVLFFWREYQPPNGKWLCALQQNKTHAEKAFYLLRQHRQQQQTIQTVHTTKITTLPTAMEMAAVTPSDKNLLMMLSSESRIGMVNCLCHTKGTSPRTQQDTFWGGRKRPRQTKG